MLVQALDIVNGQNVIISSENWTETLLNDPVTDGHKPNKY
jgi:hypothetical protein